MAKWKLYLALALLAVAVAVAVLFFSLPGPTLPASTNVYVDPHQSFCKGGAVFSCTIVLDARRGSLDVSMVKSVELNGTNTQPTVSPSGGGSLTVVATLPSISMQHGLADVGPSAKPPSVGSVVVDLSDGTMVSVTLGPGGLLN